MNPPRPPGTSRRAAPGPRRRRRGCTRRPNAVRSRTSRPFREANASNRGGATWPRSSRTLPFREASDRFLRLGLSCPCLQTPFAARFYQNLSPGSTRPCSARIIRCVRPPRPPSLPNRPTPRRALSPSLPEPNPPHPATKRKPLRGERWFRPYCAKRAPVAGSVPFPIQNN